MGVFILIGNNVEDFWKNVVNGKSGVGFIIKFDMINFKVYFVCELKDFDLKVYFDVKEICKYDIFL